MATPMADLKHTANDFVIDATLEDWEYQVSAKSNELHHVIDTLACQQYKILCDYETFDSNSRFHEINIGGLKVEYVQGFVEITVHSAGILRNSVRLFDCASWLRRLPGHSDLHHINFEPGVFSLMHKIVNCDITYKLGLTDKTRQSRAPDLQIGSHLGQRPLIGRIIFETAYPESYDHVKEKARFYLYEADEPRPSVVVVFRFDQISPRDGDRNVDLSFEVLRRDYSGENLIQVYETGFAYPEPKATAPENTQEITFSIQELIGNVHMIDDAIHKQKHPEECTNMGLKRALSKIPNGLMENLREKAERNEHVQFPIWYVTNNVEGAMALQLESDKMTSRRQRNNEDDFRRAED